MLWKYLSPTGIPEWGGYVRALPEVEGSVFSFTSTGEVDPVWTAPTNTSNPDAPGYTPPAYAREPFYDMTARNYALLRGFRVNIAKYTEYKFRDYFWETDFIENTTYDLASQTGLKSSGWIECSPKVGKLYMAAAWSDPGRPDFGTATSTYDPVTGRLSYTGTHQHAVRAILNTLSLSTPEDPVDGNITFNILTFKGLPAVDPAPPAPENIADLDWIGRSNPTQAQINAASPSRAWAPATSAQQYHYMFATVIEEGLAYWFKLTPDVYVKNGVYAGIVGRDAVPTAPYTIVYGNYLYSGNDGTRRAFNSADVTGLGLEVGAIYGAGDPVSRGTMSVAQRNAIYHRPEDRTLFFGRSDPSIDIYCPTNSAPLGMRGMFRGHYYYVPSGQDFHLFQNRDRRKYISGDFSFLSGNFTICGDFAFAAGGSGYTILDTIGSSTLDEKFKLEIGTNRTLKLTYNNQSFITTFAWTIGTTPQHLSIVKSGNVVKLYVGGVERGSMTLANTAPLGLFSGVELVFGGNRSSSADNNLSFVRDLRFYRRAKYLADYTPPVFPAWK